ncbi:PE family protein [Mycobacterium parmense]|uniref:PE domain-containing protein n=1 Tax=Mycobacterium parmense TaxID=185642 RepID=A0A7I7YQF6_9MYCO|nr:PE family protein [Mycobacterium parmense]MCV7353450.1 PE family protein [Mycobacterium parmense]BBZ43990.1 hypothetical protein MPRM_12710 [Mycobacterium parmense]
MESMSINPGAAAIGSRLVDAAGRGLGSASAALPSLTALAPAGAEEVSMQAAAAFTADAEVLLALNAAAQEELSRTGMALMEIARRYSQVDGEAAGSLTAGGAQFFGPSFAGGSGAGLMRAGTLPGAGGSAPRTPLLANLIDGVAAANPVTNPSVVPAAAGAASTALSAGTAPLSSLGSLGSGAAAGPGLTSSVAPGEDDTEGDDPGDGQPAERLL